MRTTKLLFIFYFIKYIPLNFNYALSLKNKLGEWKCGTPFPARSVLADPNRVRDVLLSLNHSKSYLCESDFKIGQAHKYLHLTKYIYNEDIQAFSTDLQNRYSEYKMFLQNIKVQKENIE